MKIGDEVYIHGFVDEIRKDTVIIRNKGGYFGTDAEEVADVVERKRGKWTPQFDKWGDYVTTVEGYKCSECGVFDSMKDNFCPNCGAEMEPSFGNKSEK